MAPLPRVFVLRGVLAALVRKVALVREVSPRCGGAAAASAPLVRRVDDRCSDPLAALERGDTAQ